MNNDQFVAWLKGVVGILGNTAPTQEQWNTICNRLADNRQYRKFDRNKHVPYNPPYPYVHPHDFTLPTMPVGPKGPDKYKIIPEGETIE